MKKPNDTANNSSDYANLINLLSIHAEATARMVSLQATVQEEYLTVIDTAKDDYTSLQKTIAEAEAAILHLVDAHPEWFEKSKTLKTPYGSVAVRKSTSLDVPNEEASIILIEQLCDDETKGRLLRKETALNLEALETLSDAELRQFRIKRVTDSNTTIKPAKLDLGKAVKDAGNDKAAA